MANVGEVGQTTNGVDVDNGDALIPMVAFCGISSTFLYTLAYMVCVFVRSSRMSTDSYVITQ